MLSAETASGSQRIFSTAALGCGTDPGHLQQIWQVHGRVELQASQVTALFWVLKIAATTLGKPVAI